MKKKKTIYFILMFLPLIVTLFALQYLPNEIPAHYDINDEVTCFGSKYGSLVLPLIVIFFGGFMLLMARLSSKPEKGGKNNEKVCIITGILSLILFNVLVGYFLYTSFNMVENLSVIALDINQLILGLLGIIMIVVGNIMPKLRKNSIIGLRTIWSMKSETTWKKSQHFGGISFMIGGILVIIICLLTKGLASLLWTLGVMAIILVIDIYYTYKIAQKNK